MHDYLVYHAKARTEGINIEASAEADVTNPATTAQQYLIVPSSGSGTKTLPPRLVGLDCSFRSFPI